LTHRKPHLRLISLIGVIVPRRIRSDWRQEWEAELHRRELLLADWERLTWRTRVDLVRRSLGAFWDALWLQQLRLEDQMLQDLRFGVRMLLKSRGFTTVALISLALGIGVNTAIFQLIDAIRLRTLPVPRPQELVEVRPKTMTGARGTFIGVRPTVTNPIWEQIRDRQQNLPRLLAWSADQFNLATGGEARRVPGLWVSGDFFNVLDIRPALGRALTAADDQRGSASSVAVLSHSFWQREFGGDPSVIGRSISLDSHPVEIVGVAPAGFFGLEIGQSFDVAVPISSEATIRGGHNRLDVGTQWWLTVMGRLGPGQRSDVATAALESISPDVFQTTLPASYPTESIKDYLAMKLEAVPAGSGVSQIRETYERSLWLLLAISALVLLIACANLANLMLARASVREREMAVRLALGASRARLIRQLLTESLLLGLVGAFIGALLAQSLSRLLVSFLSTKGNQLFISLPTDWRVFGFTAGLGVLTSVLFGLTPAFRVTGLAPGIAMKTAGRGLTANRERFVLRRLLVVSQVSLSMVLLVSALLFTRSLTKILTLDPGFRSDGVLVTRLDLTRLKTTPERSQQIKREVLDRVRTIPGVDSASSTYIVPLSGDVWGNRIWMEGADPNSKKKSSFNRVSQDYFKTLASSMLAGRDFDDRDGANSPRVAIVNETFVREFTGNTNPVGRHFWIETTTVARQAQYEIIGLVRDAKYDDLKSEFLPVAFLPESQNPQPNGFGRIVVRASGSTSGLVPAITRTISEISPEISIEFQMLDAQIRDSLVRERLMALLSSFFGALALTLACVGLYGMLSYGVSSRINEIGIRLALGARSAHVFWLILREAILLVSIGVIAGVPVIFATSRLVATLLFNLNPTDSASLCASAIALFVVTLMAGYFPARRATRVDPMIALRSE
jgi:putative ABC transport system permease protein